MKIRFIQFLDINKRMIFASITVVVSGLFLLFFDNTFLGDTVLFAPYVLMSLIRGPSYVSEHHAWPSIINIVIAVFSVLFSNLIFFMVSYSPFSFYARHKDEKIKNIILAVFTILYVLFLFVFFPIHDGV